MNATSTKWSKYAIIIAVFTTMSIVLGLIKIPSPVGSIAVDSFPGYFSAAYFNPFVGGVVGAIGHLGSAATGGFPLGYLHFAIAVFMFANCGLFGLIARRINNIWGLLFASALAIFTNGIVTPFMLVPVGLDINIAKSIWIVLVVASAINVTVAVLCVKFFSNVKIRE